MTSLTIGGERDISQRRPLAEGNPLTSPEHIIKVGKEMLVAGLTRERNAILDANDAEAITRVLQCPDCKRSIVEYGAESLPSVHRKARLNEELLELLRQKDRVVLQPCNLHGGDAYDPTKDLRIYV